jgi:hypothetical protein
MSRSACRRWPGEGKPVTVTELLALRKGQRVRLNWSRGPEEDGTVTATDGRRATITWDDGQDCDADPAEDTDLDAFAAALEAVGGAQPTSAPPAAGG